MAVLGQGGMGRVLLGVAPDGRLVAVKQVHEELVEDGGFRARFRREVDASRLVSGAYTAPVVDADLDAQPPWLASLFVPGPSLSQALESVGPLPAEQTRRLAAGLAQALIDVHRAGLIHRDLKPSNVLLAEDGVRVIDFGIVRAAEGQTKLTSTGGLVGSPAFMSPEQVDGRELTTASDVFSLGATLVVACTGSAPFGGGSVPGVLYNVVHEQPDLDAVEPSLRAIVEPCLAKHPADRPSPQELLNLVGQVKPSSRPWPAPVHRLIADQRTEIAALVSAPAIPPPPLPPPLVAPHAAPPVLPPVPPKQPAVPGAVRRGRTVWLAVAATVAVVAVIVLIATFLNRGDDEKSGASPDKKPEKSSERPYVVETTPTPGTKPLSEVPDKYKRPPPDCKESNPQQPITVPPEFGPPGGNGVYEQGNPEDGVYVESMCVWESRLGDRLDLVWRLYETEPGGRSGAERAKEHYESLYFNGSSKRDPDLGIGEEGFWLPAEDATGNNCVLYVRDVNLYLFIGVSGNSYPPGKCEDLSKSVAEAGVKAMAPQ